MSSLVAHSSTTSTLSSIVSMLLRCENFRFLSLLRRIFMPYDIEPCATVECIVFARCQSSMRVVSYHIPSALFLWTDEITCTSNDLLNSTGNNSLVGNTDAVSLGSFSAYMTWRRWMASSPANATEIRIVRTISDPGARGVRRRKKHRRVDGNHSCRGLRPGIQGKTV